MYNIKPNNQLATELLMELGYWYDLSSYLKYYLKKTYGNRFGNKSITKAEMVAILEEFEPGIKAVGRVGLYEKMIARGYSDEQLADMLKVGVLISVVAGMLNCEIEDVEELIDSSQLGFLDVKPIHPLYGQDYEEPVLSASSVFNFVNAYYGVDM